MSGTTVTSVKVGSLELLVPGSSYVGQQTYFALWAGVQENARLVEMAGRYPAYVGQTPQPRAIPLLVLLTDTTAVERMAAYQSLLAALQVPGLVALAWTEDSVTRRYWCHVTSVEPSTWMTKVVVSLTAPNPNAEVV
ncbi:MAG: hypothetical protein ACOYB2_10615 [Limnohabitans sp.]